MSDDVRIAKVRLSEVRAHGTNVRKDLGDLRDLTESIRRFGVMHPIVVEQRGDHWRLRDGHRRVAAAQIVGIQRVPAVIHADALDDDEWLTHAVHANERRHQLTKPDRVHAVTKMREAGMTWEGIAREFDVSEAAVRRWLDDAQGKQRKTHRAIKTTQLQHLFSAWRDAISTGAHTVDELLDALDSAAETGRVTEAYPPEREVVS